MDDKTENRVSMFMKVKGFLKTNEPTLAVSPPLIAVKNQFDPLVDAVFTQAAHASGKLEGYAEQKKKFRAALEQSALKVSAALFGYWQFTAIEHTLRKQDYTKRALLRYADSALHLRSVQLHEAANPVKALLAPYNCTAADVDALLADKNKFFTTIEAPKTMRKNRADARKQMLQLMKQATVLLKQLDVYMRTFQTNHSVLHNKYLYARAIDNMRGRGKKKNDAPVEE